LPIITSEIRAARLGYREVAMQARQYEPLSTQIEREIERAIGLSVGVEEMNDGLHLVGRIDSSANGQAAEDIARSMAPGSTIQNDLEVEDVWPYEAGDVTPESLSGFQDVDSLTAGDELEPDFANQSLSSDPVSAPGPTSSAEDVVNDGDVVYFPPTDPVIQVQDDVDVQILGGFSSTSTDSIEVDRSAMDGRPGDEALADAIRRELREDASTTALEVEVVVTNGIARLTGRVPDLDDAENAEAVARSVPGLVDVEEAIEVTEI
jgi:osmotically-inducible protein OsmY